MGLTLGVGANWCPRGALGATASSKVASSRDLLREGLGAAGADEKLKLEGIDCAGLLLAKTVLALKLPGESRKED
jgi:hypothetical protein